MKTSQKVLLTIFVIALAFGLFVQPGLTQTHGGEEHKAKIREVIDYLVSLGIPEDYIRSNEHPLGEWKIPLKYSFSGKGSRSADVYVEIKGKNYVYQIGQVSNDGRAIFRERLAAIDILCGADAKYDLRFVPYNAKDNTWKLADGLKNRKLYFPDEYVFFQKDSDIGTTTKLVVPEKITITASEALPENFETTFMSLRANDLPALKRLLDQLDTKRKIMVENGISETDTRYRKIELLRKVCKEKIKKIGKR